jgi:hypothetical protein
VPAPRLVLVREQAQPHGRAEQLVLDRLAVMLDPVEQHMVDEIRVLE